MTGALYVWKPLKSALLTLAATLLLAAALPRGANAQMQRGEVLRLHIIANSDSAADQRVKLLVRDAILADMPASASREEAEAYVLRHGKELLALAEDTLSKHGFSYGAQLLLGTSDFPDRAYAGVPFPAGEYQALRIVLGRGAGQNFWCVLFPPLCIVTKKERPMPDMEELTFKSSILGCIREWRDAR